MSTVIENLRLTPSHFAAISCGILALRSERLRFNRTPILPYLVVVMLTCLVGCKTELYSSLPESEANVMMAILLKNGIDAEKVKQKSRAKDGRFALMVEDAYLSEAISIFTQLGYPREKFDSMADIFTTDKLVTSPLEERLRINYAIEQEIQETLSQIDGVVTARIKIVLPDNGPFQKNFKPSSASVFIKYLPESKIENIRADIKLIVEKSIEGLDYEKVTVVMLPSEIMAEFEGDAQWVNMLGVRMPRESVGSFSTIISLALLVLLSLLGYIFYRVWQERRKKAEENDKAPPPERIRRAGKDARPVLGTDNSDSA